VTAGFNFLEQPELPAPQVTEAQAAPVDREQDQRRVQRHRIERRDRDADRHPLFARCGNHRDARRKHRQRGTKAPLLVGAGTGSGVVLAHLVLLGLHRRIPQWNPAQQSTVI